MSIYLYMYLHGYCDAVELRYISQVGGKRPMVFFACNWHDFMSPRQESRGPGERRDAQGSFHSGLTYI